MVASTALSLLLLASLLHRPFLLRPATAADCADVLPLDRDPLAEPKLGFSPPAPELVDAPERTPASLRDEIVPANELFDQAKHSRAQATHFSPQSMFCIAPACSRIRASSAASSGSRFMLC